MNEEMRKMESFESKFPSNKCRIIKLEKLPSFCNYSNKSFKHEASKGAKISGQKYYEKQNTYITLSVSLRRYLLVSKGKE